MIWMGLCCIILCSALLLGRYRLEGEIEMKPGLSFRRFRLTSVGRLLGFEWNRRSPRDVLFLVFFGNKIRIRESLTRMRPDAPRRSGLEKVRSWSPEKIHAILKWLIRLIRSMHLDKLSIRGSFGLADPALTGWVFGIMQSIRTFLPERFVLDLEPDFCTRKVRGNAVFKAGFWPLPVIAASFRMIKHVRRSGTLR